MLLEFISRNALGKDRKNGMALRAGMVGSVSSCLTGAELQFGKMNKFWRWMVVMVVQ